MTAEVALPLSEAPRGVPYVYLLSDAEGRVIYVGSTRDIRRRYREHVRRSPWFSAVSTIRAYPYRTLDAALRDEVRLIELVEPQHNHQHKRSATWFGIVVDAFFPSADDRRLLALVDGAQQ